MTSVTRRILEENQAAFGVTHPELQAAMGVPLSEIAAAAARSMVLLPDSEFDEEPVSVSAVTSRPGKGGYKASCCEICDRNPYCGVDCGSCEETRKGECGT